MELNLYHTYNEADSIWEFDSKIEEIYHADDRHNQSYGFVWNKGMKRWNDYSRRTDIYGKFVGIQIVESLKLNVYPNPCNDRFFIELEQPQSATLKIHNLYGDLINKQFLQDTEKAEIILPSSISHGVYIISIINESGVHSEQLIVQ